MSKTSFFMAVMTATIIVSSSAWAAKEHADVTHDGKVVSVVGDTLTMTDKHGKAHSHAMTIEGKVTCDGVACKSSDLKAGMKIRVTTKHDDKKVATHVEAIDKHTTFANTHDGKLVSLASHKLTMTDSKGKEHSHKVAEGATMTCDSMTCSSEHLTSGMKIRVTTKPGAMGEVTHVEAIDKDTEFSEIH